LVLGPNIPKALNHLADAFDGAQSALCRLPFQLAPYVRQGSWRFKSWRCTEIVTLVNIDSQVPTFKIEMRLTPWAPTNPVPQRYPLKGQFPRTGGVARDLGPRSNRS
jgi:hypothetical protein